MTEEELEAMDYPTPSNCGAKAKAAGAVDEEWVDSWGGAAYINATQPLPSLKRVQCGAKTYRSWNNPGWMGLKRIVNPSPGHPIYRSGWRVLWGWEINGYQDYTYAATATFNWGSWGYHTGNQDTLHHVVRRAYKTW